MFCDLRSHLHWIALLTIRSIGFAGLVLVLLSTAVRAESPKGTVDFPVGGGSVPEVGAASFRALSFAEDPATHQLRLVGGQRVPFVVHFAADAVQSYAQFLNGVSDDASSQHYSDQAQLASDRTLRPIPLTLAALAKEQVSRAVIDTR